MPLVALGADLLHDALEGQVLVTLGMGHRPVDPIDQVMEGGARVDVDAQRQGVDQEADQVWGGGPLAVGEGRAHDHRFLAADPRQEGRPHCGHHHEEGGAAFARPVAQGAGAGR